jgi:hypothetical protein
LLTAMHRELHSPPQSGHDRSDQSAYQNRNQNPLHDSDYYSICISHFRITRPRQILEVVEFGLTSDSPEVIPYIVLFSVL